MTPEHWRRIEELFDAARSRGPDDRAALLAAAEPETREQVERMLAQDGASNFLDQPAPDLPPEPTATFLTAGSQLGPYLIEASVGSGGMGHVYRAVDTRLGRKVAVKLVSSRFSARFEREARAISALNHPHICTLHDVGPDYLVMEHVEGETLAARIRKGALPLGDVLRFGAQMADALSDAHRNGVTHRDLKPANVMLARSGVKILDFGLATTSVARETLTQTGAVMGTPAYMAPEQREGRETTARTDIYALGLVLYEMATAKRVGHGERLVLGGFPERFVHVVERCLAMDPEQRWQSARDVKAELDWAASAPAALPAVQQSGGKWKYALALAAAVIAIVGGVRWFGGSPAEVPVTRLHIGPPNGAAFLETTGAAFGGLALSPDGRLAAFVASNGAQPTLWVRSLDSITARQLPGTEGATAPFFSPDGKSIGFSAQGKLQRIDPASGLISQLIESPTAAAAVWMPDGRLVYASVTGAGLFQSTGSGTVKALTQLDASLQETVHTAPNPLPGGRLLYTAQSKIPANNAVYSIAIDNPSQRVRVLTIAANGVGQAMYSSGRLLWYVNGDLLAQRFDPSTSRLMGEPHRIAERVARWAISGNGYLIHETLPAPLQAQWFDLAGNSLGPASDLAQVGVPFRIAPDSRRLLIANAQAGWVVDQNGLASRITPEGETFSGAIWSPDGQSIVANVSRGLYRIDAKGVKPRVQLTDPSYIQFGTDWSQDGRSILYTEMARETQRDVWVLPVTPQGVPSGEKARPYLRTAANEIWARFSPTPNPQWVAYQSDESGRYEVYIQAFPEPRGKFRISTRGGRFPTWGPDGRKLYYMSTENKLMAVNLKLGADAVESSAPEALFTFARVQSSLPLPVYDLAPDGKRIAVALPGEASPGLTLVTNWPALVP